MLKNQGLVLGFFFQFLAFWGFHYQGFNLFSKQVLIKVCPVFTLFMRMLHCSIAVTFYTFANKYIRKHFQRMDVFSSICSLPSLKDFPYMRSTKIISPRFNHEPLWPLSFESDFKTYLFIWEKIQEGFTCMNACSHILICLQIHARLITYPDPLNCLFETEGRLCTVALFTSLL